MENEYQFLKVKNGKFYFAFINMEIEISDFKNEIIENFSGDGYSNHSIDVGENGADNWKLGLRRGLEFALSLSDNFYKITVNKLEGKITDTNPTIIGFTGILAFCKQSNNNLSEQLLMQLESFVYSSWDDKNFEKIPNFKNLNFD